ncbi:calmodulin-binding transcription activator 4 [Sorghum bicolor]|uniref:calmodulin-binding transcription activator 4 n=1 Tax=Sorghum bicolor TaxID=4558 RepID=UPI000B425519|nr:calmodulin-binding transcription activator 4 [Sorghum bicolor]|eukprot:XP_002446301.2 calmodulin-binding transcription activator 4 [Sorghum bicolor]
MSQSFDINVLREEARSRWLKPSEVYYILQNHERFPITHEAPKKPPSGSLFLYNRRVNRYFRRDGHTWRRKKDGRTVGEAHERLKVGNVDSLSCYYAHGEQNPCFQRRCFWMLEPAYEHIVLVQYREVAEGRYYSSQLSNGPAEPLSSLGYPNAICGNQYYSSISGTSEGSESHQSYSNLSSVTEVSSYSGNKEYHKNDGSLLSIPEVGHTCLQQNRTDNGNSKNKSGLNMALKKIAEQLSLGEDDDDYIYSNQAHSVGGDNQVKQIQQEGTQKVLSRNIAPSWEDVLHSSSGLPTSSIYQQSDVEYQKNSEYHPPECLDSSDLRIQLSAAKRFLLGPEATIDSPSLNSALRNRVNSVTDTISAYDSRFESSLNPDWQTKTPSTFQSNSQGSEITELFDHGHFEPYSREDTAFALQQTNKFNIREISPEWAFSYEITKVIITGDFLCDPSNLCWAVMFGDSEVPAEIVQPGVLRCHTPLHSSGNLRICITSGNREVCSEFKEFEFRSKPTSSSFTDIAPSSKYLKSSEELLLLAKFARMLLSGNGSPEVPDGDPQSGQCPKLKMNEELWDRLIDELKVGCENPLSSVDWILEELLKSKLQQWLSAKLRGFNGTDFLSKHEQGIIHLISALGYEWALSSVLSAGVGLNFRDSNGWTALHWAAYFGREKMVAALLAAGASATAVTDPTAQDPVGKTAAFLASERGHTGLAGYLSEVSLTSYLASLTIEESDVSKGSAVVEAERAVESISQRSAQLHGGTEDELSMKDSLAAVRNAAQAAARIQNAFRAFSFRKRQQKTARLRDEYGMTQEDIEELAAASRLYHQSHASSGQFYDKAAVSIQKKYKGWKGRKHFLNMRRNAVKIQAHVRGHQVRKKYRTIVSTVSVLEKVILRWRRKGHGLRGFRAEQQPMVEAIEEDDEEDDDFDDDEAVKVFRRQKVDQAVKEAVSRVLSMVDSTEARMQYRRMLEQFRQATAELEGSNEVTSIFDSDLELLGINNFI